MCHPTRRRSLVEQILDILVSMNGKLTNIEHRTAALHVMAERVVTGRDAIHTMEFKPVTMEFKPVETNSTSEKWRDPEMAATIEDAEEIETALKDVPFPDNVSRLEVTIIMAKLLAKKRRPVGAPPTVTRYVNLYRRRDHGGAVLPGGNIYTNPRQASADAIRVGAPSIGPYVTTVPIQIPVRTF